MRRCTQLAREAEHGRRHADSLVQVCRRCGQRQLVLVDIEVQSQVDRKFARRMLLYHTRIADRFGQPVCSLAILGDTRGDWRPSSQVNSIWGCTLKLDFPISKLLDYPNKPEIPSNPFSWLTAAHLHAQATRRKPAERAESKFRLARGLYQCGLARSQILELFRLLDWLLSLPKVLEYAFKQDLARFERERNMVYITSIERIAREEGRKEGRKEARKESRKEARKEAKEAKAEACHTVRSAILSQHLQRWGEELDAEGQARLESIQDHARLVQILTQLMTAPSSQAWQASL